MPLAAEGPKSVDPNARLRPLSRTELFATVFATGAVVLVIEILGTRLIGPVFGVSLFVWAALLAVTLGSLAAGYYAGGVLVDRAPNPRLLGIAVALAGLLLSLVPILNHTVLRLTEVLGPRGGPLVAATLLFSPTFGVLGMIGPIGVRLGTTDLRAAGHGVGGVYAVSTMGSLAATGLTAFVLVRRASFASLSRRRHAVVTESVLSCRPGLALTELQA